MAVLTGWSHYRGRLKFHDLEAVMTNTKYTVHHIHRTVLSNKQAECRYRVQ